MNENLSLINTQEKKIITQMFLTLLPAQIFASATASFSSIINGLVIGNCLSQDAMVALGFVTPITLILGALSAIISGGGRVLFGRYLGRGNRDKLNEVFSNAIMTAIAIGFFLSAVIILFSDKIAYILGARGEFIESTALYIKGLAIGIIPTIVSPSLMVFLQLTEKANYAFASTLVLASSNLIFSLMNVKLFSGGIFGMGLATTASQFITLIFLGVKFFDKDEFLKFEPSQFNTKFSFTMCAYGSPAALAVVFYGLRNIILNNFAFDLAGDVAVSAMAIVGSAIGPIDAINTGVGSVAIILASLYLGEKNKDSLNKLFFIILRIGLTIAVLQIIFIAALGKPICSLFGAEGEVLTQAYRLFLGFAATKIPYTICLACVSITQSLGLIKINNIYYFFVALVSPVLFSKFLSPVFGINAVWSCYAVAELVGIAVLAIMYVSKLKNSKIGDKGITLFSDNQFLGSQMNITINSLGEMINVSEKIINFCKSNGIDDRRSNMSGLCLEETGINIINQDFGPKNYVDIFVHIEGDDVTLRLRNNAPRCNPLKSFAPYDPEDPCKNIGIRLVHKLAKDIDYQSTFGMNVLIIKL